MKMDILNNFHLICWIWIAIAVAIFPFLLQFTQPYGKHSKNNWGPMVNNNLGWLFMELPALLVFVYFVSFTSDWQNKIIFVASSLWCLHYINRSVIFPFRLKTKGKKMPLIIMISAIGFNFMNGFINGYWLANFAPKTDSLLIDFRIIIGAFIFLIGFIINQYHDNILIKLRKNAPSRSYQIPYGGLFRYVTCPNYLGEIISWLGFCIVTLGLPAFAFLIWTMTNLVPRALDNQKWYHEKFKNYPKSRKAIFPFIL